MKRQISFCLLLIVAASCGTQDLSTPRLIATEDAAPVPVITSTKLATLIPLSTATEEIVQTLLPTLNPQDASLTVKELLENNRDCELPCWWGIIPGQTSWESAKQSLSPIATSIFEGTGENTELMDVEVFFPAPYPLSGKFRQEYLIENAIVKRIEILPQQYSKYSLPKGLLQELGDPDMIFLGGSIEQPQSFQLVLYYPRQGVFALYSNELHPFQPQETVRVCFTESEIAYVDIFLWNPAESFSDTIDYIFNQYERPFYEIEHVTDLTIHEFADLFGSTGGTGCFQTPSNVWRN
jgi:hypothetical protein